MNYFEKALIALKKSDREDYKNYILKGINEKEVYSYYLGYLFLLEIDMTEFESLVNEDNDYSLAVKGQQMIMRGKVEDGIDLLKKSNTGIAKYNLYVYYIENGDSHNAKIYLDEGMELNFSLAFYEYTKDLRLDGELTRFEMNGEKFVYACDKGIEFGFIDAYYAKAKLYEEGFYLPNDLNKAIDLYNQLPESEFSYSAINLIKDYYALKDFNNVYDICIDYLKTNQLFKEIVIYYLSKIYEQEEFEKYDLIKSLIYKKLLITSTQSETYVLEIANIYYSKLKDINMATLYVKFFNKLMDYNDSCFSLYDSYEDMIFELENHRRKNIDKNDYYKNGIKEKSQENAYNAFLKGFLLDQKKCFTELAKFYKEGIMVSRDINIYNALVKSINNILVFKKDIIGNDF